MRRKQYTHSIWITFMMCAMFILISISPISAGEGNHSSGTMESAVDGQGGQENQSELNIFGTYLQTETIEFTDYYFLVFEPCEGENPMGGDAIVSAYYSEGNYEQGYYCFYSTVYQYRPNAYYVEGEATRLNFIFYPDYVMVEQIGPRVTHFNMNGRYDRLDPSGEVIRNPENENPEVEITENSSKGWLDLLKPWFQYAIQTMLKMASSFKFS